MERSWFRSNSKNSSKLRSSESESDSFALGSMQREENSLGMGEAGFCSHVLRASCQVSASRPRMESVPNKSLSFDDDSSKRCAKSSELEFSAAVSVN